MKTVSPEFVDELINFAPTEDARKMGFADAQRDGTVALFNVLQRNKVAYLADEVGMGKTYVALGVMALVRYLDPHARIVVIAPRENIQRKWVKELKNFVRNNWCIVGNRVKSLQGEPAWDPVHCDTLIDFVREAMLSADRDFFLRMTSFSLALKQAESRRRLRQRLFKELRWVNRRALAAKTPETFRDAFGSALNAGFPDADLLVVDEAHNLKHGYRARGSIRRTASWGWRSATLKVVTAPGTTTAHGRNGCCCSRQRRSRKITPPSSVNSTYSDSATRSCATLTTVTCSRWLGWPCPA